MTVPKTSATTPRSDGSPKSILQQSARPVAGPPVPPDVVAPPDALRTMRQTLLQETQLAEFARFLGAAPFERTTARVGVRNGTIPARAGETAADGGWRLLLWDHPRTRGGDLRNIVRTVAQQGPSPHARGRVREGEQGPGIVRTIPARAGETYSRRAVRGPCRDHPRTRGGDRNHPRHQLAAEGPSPHARGRPVARGRRGQLVRTIPARAGETPSAHAPSPTGRDHPRTRGGDVWVLKLASMC